MSIDLLQSFQQNEHNHEHTVYENIEQRVVVGVSECALDRDTHDHIRIHTHTQKQYLKG
jgi:hypothetical protein